MLLCIIFRPLEWIKCALVTAPRTKVTPYQAVRRYRSQSADSDHAFQVLTNFSLHLPNEIERDVRSKLVIVTSNKTSVNSKDKSISFIHCRAIYQCQCGSDNTDGRLASKKREMPWENVDCGSWFRLTTTHYDMDTDSSSATGFF
jgi:hypothetical protein